jgi:preprotein translocase subunit SecF
MRDPKFRQQANRVHTRRAKQAGKVDADGDSTDEVDVTDDHALAGEQRRERAIAAAAGVPARAAASRRAPTSRTPRSGRGQSARPSRPTGKRHR